MEGEITRILQRLREGKKDAESQLINAVYGELKLLARAHLRGQRRDCTLQPTALVNEAYLKLTGAKSTDWNDHTHFFRVASRAMRQILVDHARERCAAKRGGSIEVLPLDETRIFDKGRSSEILALDEALDRLQLMDPRIHEIVELRFFGGLSIEETANALGISPRTVKREWRTGRAWLRGELVTGGAGHAAALGENQRDLPKSARS